MTTPTASIVIGVTDHASKNLMNLAARMERINRSFSDFGKRSGISNVAAGFGLINEQLGSKRSLDKRSAVRGFNISGASRRRIYNRWTALRLKSRLRWLDTGHGLQSERSVFCRPPA
jgi:hypothetical protein